MQLFKKESLEALLKENKTYTKEEILDILDNMQTNYDLDIVKKRIRHFCGLVPQNTLEDIISVISDTKNESFYD